MSSSFLCHCLHSLVISKPPKTLIAAANSDKLVHKKVCRMATCVVNSERSDIYVSYCFGSIHMKREQGEGFSQIKAEWFSAKVF